jgi:hypothetical protein
MPQRCLLLIILVLTMHAPDRLRADEVTAGSGSVNLQHVMCMFEQEEWRRFMAAFYGAYRLVISAIMVMYQAPSCETAPAGA